MHVLTAVCVVHSTFSRTRETFLCVLWWIREDEDCLADPADSDHAKDNCDAEKSFVCDASLQVNWQTVRLLKKDEEITFNQQSSRKKQKSSSTNLELGLNLLDLGIALWNVASSHCRLRELASASGQTQNILKYEKKNNNYATKLRESLDFLASRRPKSKLGLLPAFIFIG